MPSARNPVSTFASRFLTSSLISFLKLSKDPSTRSIVVSNFALSNATTDAMSALASSKISQPARLPLLSSDRITGRFSRLSQCVEEDLEESPRPHQPVLRDLATGPTGVMSSSTPFINIDCMTVNANANPDDIASCCLRFSAQSWSFEFYSSGCDRLSIVSFDPPLRSVGAQPSPAQSKTAVATQNFLFKFNTTRIGHNTIAPQEHKKLPATERPTDKDLWAGA